MILISHRVNTIKQLKSTNKKFGIEIDLRDRNNHIEIVHDPFLKGENLEKYLKFFDHKFLICNIKSERIENQVIKILKKYSIKNFFFLDSSFPMIYHLKKKQFNKIAIRYSIYEDFPKKNFDKNFKWVWFDTFAKLPSILELKKVRKKNKKICLVSPELYGVKIKKKKIQNFINKNKFYIDMVCTKQKFFKNWT